MARFTYTIELPLSEIERIFYMPKPNNATKALIDLDISFDAAQSLHIELTRFIVTASQC